MSKKILLPLRIAQGVTAITLAIGCFFGAPTDATLAGAFWTATAAIVASEVIDVVLQNGRSAG